jgi:hypothetical protein
VSATAGGEVSRDRQLAVRQQQPAGLLSFVEQERFALAVFKTRVFGDVKTAEQALLKMQLGKELGIGPAASLKSIQFIGDGPALSANTMAALVKRAYPRYDYRVKAHTNSKCEIEFLRDGKPQGTVAYSMDDAKLAGLVGKDVWKKYPKALLFSRALAIGFRMYCGDLALGGLVYTPEELGSDEADVIDAEVTPARAPVASAAAEAEVVDRIGKGEAADKIRRLVQERGSDMAGLLRHYGAAAVEDLTAEDAEAALRILEAKGRSAGGETA